MESHMNFRLLIVLLRVCVSLSSHTDSRTCVPDSTPADVFLSSSQRLRQHINTDVRAEPSQHRCEEMFSKGVKV